MRKTLLSLAALGLVTTASAQVNIYRGASPNNHPIALDFDNPFVASGPISSTDPAITSAGITSISLIGGGWNAAGDLLTAGSNVNGQCMVSQNGALAVGGVPDPLDTPTAGDGFEIVLANAVDEFQVLFADQAGFTYDVELLNGATSLGMATATYSGAFPAPPDYFRAASPFDTIRIMFVNAGGVGIDELAFGNGPPPPPPPALPDECAETTYLNNNGGNIGGAVYFDVTCTEALTISGLMTNYSAAAGTPVGIEVYTTPGTYNGNETDPTLWTLAAMDDAMAVSNGAGVPTPINFSAPLSLPMGTTGIALVSVGSAHAYTNGTGANQNAVAVDGRITLDLGKASNAPFLAPLFDPRVWNGQLCADGPSSPGTSYCGPAVANSTGNPAEMGASGSSSVAANDLVLEASDLPLAAFGFFLTSRTQGLTMMPGGSQGNLCLGGQIGRFVGPGQIQNSGATGMISLAIDNMQQPTPTGFVQIAAGETWNFQAWYRDAISGVATSNFTDGREITFVN